MFFGEKEYDRSYFIKKFIVINIKTCCVTFIFKQRMAFKKSIPFVLAFLFGLGLSCNSDEGTIQKPPSGSLNKIMPLGASRVEGDRPEFESYRYELWKLLTEDDWDFDYIGSMTDRAAYPEYRGMKFDPDHEGRGGWTSEDILDNISDWLAATNDPDIVLFSSPGGNDILNGDVSVTEVMENVSRIVEILRNENPKVTIVIELLAPGKTDFMTNEFTAAFDEVRQETLRFADEESTEDSEILTVDMLEAFNDDLLADEVHYNEAGAQFIANRYYDVLQTILKR